MFLDGPVDKMPADGLQHGRHIHQFDVQSLTGNLDLDATAAEHEQQRQAR